MPYLEAEALGVGEREVEVAAGLLAIAGMAAAQEDAGEAVARGDEDLDVAEALGEGEVLVASNTKGIIDGVRTKVHIDEDAESNGAGAMIARLGELGEHTQLEQRACFVHLQPR
ncbi:MAG TPA: hypothetical protein VLS89_14900 [Candidatus Nanopelagicales bacterium]|nr:hypothetical protein [Candidatus Nanopelagicales bacterium]